MMKAATMTNERDLITSLTLAVIDLAGVVAQIVDALPAESGVEINATLNAAVTKIEEVAVAIHTADVA
jgi:Ca2+/H+ antiporter